MEKVLNNTKVFFEGVMIVFVFFIVIILLDTFQSKLFNTQPFFKTMYYNISDDIYAVSEGVLVNNYEYINGERKSIFKWDV